MKPHSENAFLSRAHRRSDSVELPLIGHAAGDRELTDLIRMAASDPAEWPDSWKTVERKAFPRFASGRLSLAPTEGESDRRRSTRAFTGAGIDAARLSRVLTPLQITGTTTGHTRSAPSAGGLFPVETYVLSLETAFGEGTFHYDTETHALVPIFELPPVFVEAPHAAIGSTPIPGAAAFIVFTAVLYRTMRKYGSRGYRYALLEAGACAASVDHAARQVDLGTVWLGGFDDEVVGSMIGVRPALDMEVPLLLMAVGSPVVP